MYLSSKLVLLRNHVPAVPFSRGLPAEKEASYAAFFFLAWRATNQKKYGVIHDEELYTY